MRECACIHVGWAASLKKKVRTHARAHAAVQSLEWPAGPSRHVHPGDGNKDSVELQPQVGMKSHTGHWLLNESCVSGTKKCFASYVQIVLVFFLCSASNGPTCFQAQGWENSQRATMPHEIAGAARPRLYFNVFAKEKHTQPNTGSPGNLTPEWELLRKMVIHPSSLLLLHLASLGNFEYVKNLNGQKKRLKI